MARGLLLLVLLLSGAARGAPVELSGLLSGPAAERAWIPCGGTWAWSDGVLRQTETWVAEDTYEQSGHIYLRQPAFSDLTLDLEFRVDPRSPGVGGAEVLLRASDSRTYYVIQFSTQANGVLLARASAAQFWTDIARAYEVPLPRGEWHRVRVRQAGTLIVITVNGKEVLQAQDATLTAGLFGFGSSQALLEIRNLSVTGTTVELQPPWQDLGGRAAKPDYQIICAEAGAGGYQAFPDLARCANGDLLCVFYAGYAHISVPTPALLQGARICSVRSRDEGQTWSAAAVVADTPWDDRDPSLACLRDGTLICNWFTYYGDYQEPQPGKPTRFKELWLASSPDQGVTWSAPRRVTVTEQLYWGASSPIVELSDGSLLWPVYRELQQPLRVSSAMLRSTDHGDTWTGPHWVAETHLDNDEPAVLELPDGRILCLMRNNQGDSMWCSESRDRGVTWTAPRPVGFPGHAPYLYRSAAGVLLLGHRLPGTALHWSLDDGASWAGSLLLDACIGAYPSLLGLRDGTVLCVYYEEGPHSAIRAQKLSVSRTGVTPLPWAQR